MGAVRVEPVRGVEGLTAAWLTDALAATTAGVDVVGARAEPVGTGQVADTYRLHLEYGAGAASELPATVIAKVPSANPVSRMASQMTRTYEIEASFYLDLAESLAVRAPGCYAAGHDPATDDYVVLLEDVAPARQGDQLAGCSRPEIEGAVDELARLHGSRWDDPTLAELPWLARSTPENLANTAGLIAGCVPMFIDRYAERLRPSTVALVERLAPRLGPLLARRDGPQCVVHNDFRADNLLFGGDRVVVVDWQTVVLGPPAADLGYLIGTSLPTEQRRRWESELVDRYLSGLGVEVDRDWWWTQYRRSAFSGLIMAIVASALVGQTDRGDDMFMAMAERPADQVADLDAEALLPH